MKGFAGRSLDSLFGFAKYVSSSFLDLSEKEVSAVILAYVRSAVTGVVYALQGVFFFHSVSTSLLWTCDVHYFFWL